MAAIEPSPRVKQNTRTAALILRDTVYSLLDSGFEQQQVVAALEILTGESRGTDWQETLTARTRARFHLEPNSPDPPPT
jgi:hypothetical protein